MKKNMFKKMGMGIATTMVAGAMFFSQTGVSEAALVSKKVETDPQIKILNNSVLVNSNVAPIIIDGTTYLPVRSLAGVLNKTVNWDGTTRSIFITDTVSSTEAQLRDELQQINTFVIQLQNDIKTKDSKITTLESAAKTKDAKIAELEKAAKTKDDKIAELEKKLKSKSKSVDIDDLEDELNDDYGDWKGLDIDISLRGDEDEIDVEIAIDVDDAGKNWDKLDDDDFEDLVDDIVNDIWDWDEFEDAEINGEIVDSSDDDYVLYDFYAEDGDIDFD